MVMAFCIFGILCIILQALGKWLGSSVSNPVPFQYFSTQKSGLKNFASGPYLVLMLTVICGYIMSFVHTLRHQGAAKEH
jgi:hypothetical protein